MDSGADRGASTVIGFIIIFSAVVISFSLYQGVIIPDQNRQAEFQHNERTQGQFLELQDAVRRTGTTGVSQSVSIQVGVDYPDRTLGVNFATAGGRVSTVEPNRGGPNNITFENVRAVRPEVRDYWNSSESTLAFPTKDIVYRPSYTRYTNAPETVLSNTAVFNQFDGANLSVADQILIQGNRITIVAINGTLDKSRGGEGASVSVDTEPLSVATSSISVESNGTGDINITVPTSVANRSAWNESSLGEEDAVTAITVEGSNLTITLKDQTYSLRMAKVGVGSETADEGAEYVVPVDQPPRTVFNETSHSVTVEVRDRFNNPESGTEVNATVVGDGSIEPMGEIAETDDRGQVVFNYTAPSNPTEDTLVFNISGGPAGGADDRAVVNHTVAVVRTGGTGGGSGGSTGIGTGGTSTYSTSEPNETISSSNGLWTDITCTDRLYLRDGKPAIRPSGAGGILQGDVVRLMFTMRDNASSTANYTMDVRLARASDGSWNKKNVLIYEDGQNSRSATLKTSAAASIYESGETDIFDLASYDGAQSGTGTFGEYLSNIRDLDNNAPVEWQTARMVGRVEAEPACDSLSAPPQSGVETVDGSTPSGESTSLEFDIQIAKGEQKEVNEYEVTTPANSNSNADSLTQLKIGGGTEVRLVPSNPSGANQTGDAQGTYNVDSGRDSMNTNAIFENGAVLSATLKQTNGGNLKLTYETTTAANADITVTLYFTDGTSHEVYLRVTNVNN
jgi:hypothetical protein